MEPMNKPIFFSRYHLQRFLFCHRLDLEMVIKDAHAFFESFGDREPHKVLFVNLVIVDESP